MSRTFKTALHQLNFITGDFQGNFRKVLNSVLSVEADIHVLPECAVTNYASDDLFLDKSYQIETGRWLDQYRRLSKEYGLTIVVGSPLGGKTHGRKPGNGLVVYQDGDEVFRYLKTHLPNYDVFDDVRWFESRLEQAGLDGLAHPWTLQTAGGPVRIGFYICEDIWFPLRDESVDVVISINSSPYAIAKGNFRRRVFADRVKEAGAPLVYVNQVGGNDELVWDGASCVMDPAGVVYEMEPGKEGAEVVVLRDDGNGFFNSVEKPPVVLPDAMERYLMACIGLRDYVEKNGFEKVIFGLSGGADSTLVAAMCVDVFGAERVKALMMPSPYTSVGSNDRAARLAAGMGGGFNAEVWPITEEYEAHRAKFRRLKGREMSRLADENLQAQIRGDILSMNSNDHGRMVIIGTSNKSEILMGYGTLYGDLRGGFNPLKDLYKSIDVFPILEMRLAESGNPNMLFGHLWEQTFGRLLAALDDGAREALREVIEEPPSAELSLGQLDTDSLPPYPRLDAVLWEIEDARESQTDEEIAALLGEDVAFVADIRRRRARYEYKRNQSAPGPKIHRKSATRKDRRFPMTTHFP